MTTTILWPIVFIIVGGLAFKFAKGDEKEMGRLIFFVGLLWTAYQLSGKALHL